MEIWKTVLFVLGILTFSENQLTVKNLSCFCHGENVTRNVACPAAKWPLPNSNWFLECREGARCVIKAAVILPKNTSYVTSLAKVVPALYLAEEDAKARGILPRGVVFSFKQYDDQCMADEGQISAVEAYANDRPHVIFGPTCEYSVASVARMVRFWNIPLLTVGAMTLSLQNRTSCTNQYHLLVRAGVVDFSQITAFIIRVFAAYKWKKVNLVYEKNGYSYVSGVFSCKLMMENLVHSLHRENITYNGIDLEAESSKHFIRDSLASKKFLNDNSMLSRTYTQWNRNPQNVLIPVTEVFKFPKLGISHKIIEVCFRRDPASDGRSLRSSSGNPERSSPPREVVSMREMCKSNCTAKCVGGRSDISPPPNGSFLRHKLLTE